MKIIQTCGSSSWGGLEMMALQTSEQLRKKKHEVILLCKKNSVLYKKANRKGIKCIEIFKDVKNALSSIRNLRKILISENFDIVHTHLSHDLWSLVPALRGHNAKLFLTKHMGSYVKKKDIFHKYLYKKVNGVFAVSNYVRESLIDTCPIKNEKIKVLPDFISIERFNKKLFDKEKILDKYSIPRDCFIVGMAGRLTPGKGHKEFINAAKIVNEQSKKNVIFLIVGGASRGEEEYVRKILTLADESGIGQKIIFTGYKENIAEFLNIMNIFVMPSHEEAFGIVLLEAMAMELPLIATNNAGAIDIVIDSETGILIEPKNHDALAKTIIELMNNPEKMKSFGINGRKRVEEKFTSEKVIQKLIQYYTDL